MPALKNLIAAGMVLGSLCQPALAIDPWDDVDPAAALAEARDLIAADDFSGAVDALRAVLGTGGESADAYNLLGYAWRQLGEHDRAGPAHAEALRRDPNHLGALAYQGELFLATGQPDPAHENLVALTAMCGEHVPNGRRSPTPSPPRTRSGRKPGPVLARGHALCGPELQVEV